MNIILFVKKICNCLAFFFVSFILNHCNVTIQSSFKACFSWSQISLRICMALLWKCEKMSHAILYTKIPTDSLCILSIDVCSWLYCGTVCWKKEQSKSSIMINCGLTTFSDKVFDFFRGFFPVSSNAYIFLPQYFYHSC